MMPGKQDALTSRSHCERFRGNTRPHAAYCGSQCNGAIVVPDFLRVCDFHLMLLDWSQFPTSGERFEESPWGVPSFLPSQEFCGSLGLLPCRLFPNLIFHSPPLFKKKSLTFIFRLCGSSAVGDLAVPPTTPTPYDLGVHSPLKTTTSCFTVTKVGRNSAR